MFNGLRDRGKKIAKVVLLKLEGNTDHPINQGTLCARGQASLLNLYDPDRLQKPVSLGREISNKKEMSWIEVDTLIPNKLKAVAAGNGRLRILSAPVSGNSTRRLIGDFLSNFKNGKWIELEPLELDELAQAQEINYGRAVVPHYRFEEAEWVLSLGADFLGNWLSPVGHAVSWAKGRKLDGQRAAQAKMSKLVTFESMMSLTGSNSDERYPIRAGSELFVALAVAHEIVKNGSAPQIDSNLSATLAPYSPEKIADYLGLENGAVILKNVSRELLAKRGKSLVIAGGISSKTENSLALQVAVNLLNSLLENEGKTVDGVVNFAFPHGSQKDFLQLVSDMQAGQVDVLIIHRSNPLYTLPQSGFEEALKKVSLVVAISDRIDETGVRADYVLPDHHYLENWGDAHPRNGIYSIQQPVIAPLFSSRAFQDSLLIWAKKSGLARTQMLSQSSDWHQYLQANWKETLFKDAKSIGSFDQFWEGVLRAGVLDLRSAQKRLGDRPAARPFQSGSLGAYLPKALPAQAPLTLALYAKVSMYDGRSANNAWLQEMPDPISSITWDNYINVSPLLAKRLGVKKDDVVELKTGSVQVHLPVNVQPGLQNDTVAVAVGYGRRSVGKVGNGAGVDMFPFVRVGKDGFLFSGQSVEVGKTGKFYNLAATQWHTVTEDRPIINDITLDEFRKDPGAVSHTDPEIKLESVPSIWPSHEYPTYRWGMSIDLNSCTGCGACVIACQAENNIPVVGREQVRNSRQMHWIRIDRYYSEAPGQPDMVFQPMLCQHCENAPCETVCPVVATVHDDEGLNVQIYNRCVGTRYCQNNCPYKVRRFNFFDHWKSYEGTMNMIWNPDVTVRTRGIMEKCTFCTQRIREAKDLAKDANERVKDGDVKTACQQTCPTDAIVFGDMNDPSSRVMFLKNSPQAFRVLEMLNTKPSVSYTTKVRNKPAKAKKAEEGRAHE